MYESPIEMFSVTDYVDTIRKQIDEQIEEAVWSEVTKVGVNVNKEELIRALKYDRNQYEKGYADGKRNGIEWHPYPEEKPKNEFKKYIVTTSCGEVENRWWLNTFWAVTVSKVIAWAELPSPYRKETGE